MSESIPIFSHTTASGSVKPAIVAPRGAFVRATNLPSSWKKARIALVYSLRGLGANDATPVTETIAASALPLQQVQVGFSNGAGMPGTAGVRFVGAGAGVATSNNCVGYVSSPGWQPFCSSTAGNYALVTTRWGDGTTWTAQTSTAAQVAHGITTPLATTSFCAARLIEVDVSTDGSVTAKQAVLNSQSPNSQEDVGVILENLLLAAVGSGSALTGGWWSSSTPVGCTHLFIRLPFVNNRLVIHGYKVAQVG